MSKYKLIALDLDGTLLGNDLEISQANRKWIRRAEEAGLIVCFATGRGRGSSEQYWDVVSSNSPMVVVNGAEVWLDHQKLLSRYYLPSDAITNLHKLAVEHGTWFWGHGSQGVVSKEDWRLGQENETDWLKFGFVHDDGGVLAKVAEIIKSWNKYEVTSSAPDNLEIGQKGISKASALQEVTTQLKIKAQEVAVIGDSLNDLAMIEWAGLGAAMGNADRRVKAAADYLSATNAEDGVAQFIQLVLKQS